MGSLHAMGLIAVLVFADGKFSNISSRIPWVQRLLMVSAISADACVQRLPYTKNPGQGLA